jgi:hypothetical protein
MMLTSIQWIGRQLLVSGMVSSIVGSKEHTSSAYRSEERPNRVAPGRRV